MENRLRRVFPRNRFHHNAQFITSQIIFLNKIKDQIIIKKGKKFKIVDKK